MLLIVVKKKKKKKQQPLKLYHLNHVHMPLPTECSHHGPPPARFGLPRKHRPPPPVSILFKVICRVVRPPSVCPPPTRGRLGCCPLWAAVRDAAGTQVRTDPLKPAADSSRIYREAGLLEALCGIF